VAEAVRAGRLAIGWSVGELASSAGVSKATVWKVEAGILNVTVDTAGRLLGALGVTLDVRYQIPFSDPRQRDAAHARCVAYVQRRLEALGWIVAREVEIVDGRWRGWIDVLAWNPATRELLVIEVKTEIRDLGRIERTLGWYRRLAAAAGRRRGWQATRVATWLLVLATAANETRILENRDGLRQSFPERAPEMLVRLERSGLGRSGMALIDPRRRRRDWLVRTRADGRRSPAPYRDYAHFLFVIRRGVDPQETSAG
jgi:transcriptional regulator with XRE-family HTH domain